ncbi:NTF2 fold immunity protein [Massilia sp. 9I]|uniref:NTF2 fold immunity protein n=1 Tax=Massilia sp. 9I TaxID=2653152 RepID=UPI0012F27B9A|nr:NTF2 fold immunity protein [Massilia sp. 9I]VXB50338.1 conserved exported hypothetical protein [Massilia sp. 9I]
MKQYLIALVLVGLLGSPSFTTAQSLKPTGKENYRPPEGYVPNAKVAEQIAYAVLIPIYGRENIDKQRPFKVTLKRHGTVWKVEGTLPESVAYGGTFEVEIAKHDGRIIRMAHFV